MKWIVLVFLLACSNLGPLQPDQKQDIDQVGFVSLLNEDMPIMSLGTTAFQNDYHHVNIGGWKLSPIIYEEFSKEFKSLGRSMRPFKVDEKQLAELVKSNEAEFTDTILDQAKAQGTKYVLIIQPRGHGSYPHPEGAGLFCRAAFGMKGVWNATLQFHVALWSVGKKEKVYQRAFNPSDLLYRLDRPCSDYKKSQADKFVVQFENPMQELARLSVTQFMKSSALKP